MRLSFFVAILVLLLIRSIDAYDFSQATRNADVAFLDRLTLPYRQHLRRLSDPATTLVDFLASRRGLVFLALNAETLWYQSLLEREYGRGAMCKNLQSADTEPRGLTTEEKRLKKCLCNRLFPFLHCLAIGSQLLRDAGLANADIETKIIKENVGPSLEERRRDQVNKFSSQRHDWDTMQFDNATCFPTKTSKYDGEILVLSECTLPVSRVFDVKLSGLFATERLPLWFDVRQCLLYDVKEGTPVCKQIMDHITHLVDDTVVFVKTRICVNLEQVGDTFTKLFGVDRCFAGTLAEVYWYQRRLKVAFDLNFGGWGLSATFMYKPEDGPDCTCRLDTFACTPACKMRKDDLTGTWKLSWDFFFAGGYLARDFDERQECYTDHGHLPVDCNFAAA